MSVDHKKAAANLRDVRDRLRRLMPSNSNPERFHVDRDQLCKDIGALANLFDPPRKPAHPSTVWRADP